MATPDGSMSAFSAAKNSFEGPEKSPRVKKRLAELLSAFQVAKKEVENATY